MLVVNRIHWTSCETNAVCMQDNYYYVEGEKSHFGAPSLEEEKGWI